MLKLLLILALPQIAASYGPDCSHKGQITHQPLRFASTRGKSNNIARDSGLAKLELFISRLAPTARKRISE